MDPARYNAKRRCMTPLCYNPFCNKTLFYNNLLQNDLGEHYFKFGKQLKTLIDGSVFFQQNLPNY